jgi:hypothetical protein
VIHRNRKKKELAEIDSRVQRAQAVDFVQKRLKEENNGYYAVIQIDNCY